MLKRNSAMCDVRLQRGFTLAELAAIMIIVGVLAAVAAPRFFDRSVFENRGFYDEAVSTLRYAQKTAVAQHRFVCVAFTANSITLSYGATAACGNNLTSPTGVTPYIVTARGVAAFAAVPAAFNFDALGRASVAQSITVSGYATPITVEAETGYVH